MSLVGLADTIAVSLKRDRCVQRRAIKASLQSHLDLAIAAVELSGKQVLARECLLSTAPRHKRQLEATRS